ncbi:alpha/beta fold hydrolase [Streptomyces sp. TRM 70351]|uniref:alpha/beta fold hydrolase n=1 Tax=Streptomyces sp. TRM 70351 TaxID=3116552 RepID=UPI002E7B9AE0|nr:alpha/beta fold hydrolase [Streptomyces sp. TRM 70351]MEE1928865.1 alpha/beta fold hydrolase [Streptomyces sp. TRM 70351]
MVDGLLTVYLESGSGPDLLLLHGAGGSSFDWIAVMRQLADTHHVFALDMPGSGKTPPLDAYSPQRYAAFVESFTASIGLKDYVLVGNSFGGMVAIHVARSVHRNVERLVLVSSGGLGRAANPLQILTSLPVMRRIVLAMSQLPGAPLINTIGSALSTTYQPWKIPPLWYKDRVQRARDPQFVRTSLAVLADVLTPFGQRYDLRPELPHLDMPTLVVWGVGDRLAPVWQAASASLLPRGDCNLLPAGHCPQLDVAGDFVRVVRSFLNDNSHVTTGTDRLKPPVECTGPRGVK